MNPSPVFRRFNSKELKNVSVQINSYLKKSSPRLHNLTQTISSIKQWAFSLQKCEYNSYSSSGVHVSANHGNLPSKTQNDLMIVRTCPEVGPEDCRKSESYALYRDDENFTKYADLDFPFTHPYWWCGYFRIIGNINGVLCIIADKPNIQHDTYLWNPSIRKFVQLPLPKYTYESYGPFEQELGFGYDAETKDYKVVRLVQFDSYDRVPHPLKVELYSVSTGVWKDISALASGMKFWLFGRSGQAYCNGAAHWVPIRPSDMIVSFHFGEEVFGCFKTPIGHSDYPTPRTLVVQDSLCLVDGRIIWMMEEYGNTNSWVKWLDSSPSAGQLIGFRKEGEVLFELDGKLCSFDQKKAEGKEMNILTGSPKDLGIRSKVDGDYENSFYCDAYVESLALADQGESEEEEEEEGSSSSI